MTVKNNRYLVTIEEVRNVWSHYLAISSSAALTDNKLVIVLDIPLINSIVDIYRVIDLVLLNIRVIEGLQSSDKNWVAYHTLETSIFAK